MIVPQQRSSSSKAAECFFCGLSSDVFDTNRSNGFKLHEAEEHNMWSYLYFFAHLDAKPMTEFSVIEQDVAIQLYKDGIDFYPIGRALGVNDGHLATDSAVQLDDRVAQLQAAHETLRVYSALPLAFLDEVAAMHWSLAEIARARCLISPCSSLFCLHVVLDRAQRDTCV